MPISVRMECMLFRLHVLRINDIYFWHLVSCNTKGNPKFLLAVNKAGFVVGYRELMTLMKTSMIQVFVFRSDKDLFETNIGGIISLYTKNEVYAKEVFL